jgi:hypothetical protein
MGDESKLSENEQSSKVEQENRSEYLSNIQGSLVAAVAVGSSPHAHGTVNVNIRSVQQLTVAGSSDIAQKTSITSDSTADPLISLAISLDDGLRFIGDQRDAEILILEADAAVAAKESVAVSVTIAGADALRPVLTTTDTLSRDEREAYARAKLKLAQFDAYRKRLTLALEIFLFKARLWRETIPSVPQAAMCLLGIINNRKPPGHGIGHTKLDLFLDRNHAIDTNIMITNDEMAEIAKMDGDQLDAYKHKLVILGGDSLILLPEPLRFERAYPEVIWKLVSLMEHGYANESIMSPMAWNYGPG